MNQWGGQNDAVAGDGGDPPPSNSANRTEQKAPDTTRSWQRPLQGLPPYPRGARIEGSDKERYRSAIAKAYDAGGSTRDISSFIGRSYGWVFNLLGDAAAVKRSCGRRPRHVSRPGCPTATSAHVESTLRARIVDGTYDFGTKIPTISSLCEEFGTSLYTVEVAVGRLRTRGLLFSWPGKGTVVTDPQNPPTGPSLRVRTGPGQWETWTVLEPGRTNRSHVRTVITARIADGTYAPGHRIPSCKELAEELGASYSTVYPALKELEKRRLLGRREGKPRQLFVQPRHERDAALKAGNR